MKIKGIRICRRQKRHEGSLDTYKQLDIIEVDNSLNQFKCLRLEAVSLSCVVDSRSNSETSPQSILSLFEDGILFFFVLFCFVFLFLFHVFVFSLSQKQRAICGLSDLIVEQCSVPG